MLGIISIGSLLILLQFVPGTLSWGREGHYATCKIAEGLLTVEAMTAVKMLLPEYANGDLAAVCSWADDIRHSFGWHWTSCLHYVDTPDFKCNYNYCRDCHDLARRKDRCVAGAIYNYSAQLSAYQYPHSEHEYNLTEALLFLSHFIGDIHQDKKKHRQVQNLLFDCLCYLKMNAIAFKHNYVRCRVGPFRDE